MPFFACDAPACREPGVRRQGSCVICSRHLCVMHMQAGFHTCPSLKTNETAFFIAQARALEDEIATLISRIDIDALCSRASTLRNGISCTVPQLTRVFSTAIMGGMNYHVPITFDDGIVWFCRIRRQNASSPPLELQNRIILSEAATLRFLETIGVPVPEVYDFAIMSPSNPIGVGYLLVQKLEGKILNWNDLNLTNKRKILEQFTRIFVLLERYSFPAIGCLRHPDDLSIGPLVTEHNADMDDQGGLHLLGPFKTSLEYRTATIKQQLGLIVHGEAYPEDPVDTFLIHRYVLECISSNPRRGCGDSTFYLKHMDDKGDHILIDEDFNITGIIDWEWAQTTPKSEAFAAPLFLLDVGAYYEGRNELSNDEELFASILEEMGNQELASLVRSGRVEHRIIHCTGGDNGDPESLQPLFAGFRSASQRANHWGSDWSAWRIEALERYKTDTGLQLLLK